MDFYTNVQVTRNDFLVRGYSNGKKVIYKEEFQPTVYLKSRKKTKWKTLDGDYVEPFHPGTVSECREFYKKYEDVPGFEIFGNERYIYQYISEKYPQDEIKFDISKIDIITIDIEVKSENGFPDPAHCAEELLTISIQNYNTKEVMTWGRKPYTPTQSNVQYFQLIPWLLEPELP